jgi:hypothetical protein
LGITKRDDVIAFLSFLKERENPEFSRRWLDYALDHRTSDVFASNLYRLQTYSSLSTAWYTERERMETSRTEQTRWAAQYSR